jgi:hypothetical protein
MLCNDWCKHNLFPKDQERPCLTRSRFLSNDIQGTAGLNSKSRQGTQAGMTLQQPKQLKKLTRQDEAIQDLRLGPRWTIWIGYSMVPHYRATRLTSRDKKAGMTLQQDEAIQDLRLGPRWTIWIGYSMVLHCRARRLTSRDKPNLIELDKSEQGHNSHVNYEVTELCNRLHSPCTDRP